jgi:hypothetical protein
LPKSNKGERLNQKEVYKWLRNKGYEFQDGPYTYVQAQLIQNLGIERIVTDLVAPSVHELFTNEALKYLRDCWNEGRLPNVSFELKYNIKDSFPFLEINRQFNYVERWGEFAWVWFEEMEETELEASRNRDASKIKKGGEEVAKDKINLSDRLTCPFDSAQEITERPLGDLELHMGLKSDARHIAWRTKHGLPPHMNFRDMHKQRRDIRIAIIQDWNIFKPRKKAEAPSSTPLPTQEQIDYALRLFTKNITPQIREKMTLYLGYSDERLRSMLQNKRKSTVGIHVILAARLAASDCPPERSEER